MGVEPPDLATHFQNALRFQATLSAAAAKDDDASQPVIRTTAAAHAHRQESDQDRERAARFTTLQSAGEIRAEATADLLRDRQLNQVTHVYTET